MCRTVATNGWKKNHIRTQIKQEKKIFSTHHLLRSTDRKKVSQNNDNTSEFCIDYLTNRHTNQMGHIKPTTTINE